MPNDTGFIPPQTRADVTEAAIAGLTASPKTLPAKLFYDDEGCRLFYEITRLPEYYLTRTEKALLKSIANTALISAALTSVEAPGDRDGAALIEFGGSDETKARILLDQDDSPFKTYVSIDVAALALAEMRKRMATTHPELAVVTVVGDFMQKLALPALTGARMGFFPGSTIGNLTPADAVRFLSSARQSLGAGSWFLLGADLRKAPEKLLPAYNDAKGVTAAFNLNVLRRLNREAAANFDLEKFQHKAVWNDTESRIEMHLVSSSDQTVELAGHSIRFKEGETIHTENSYKHTRDRLVSIANDAGWRLEQFWTDPAGLFGVFLLRD